jgi:hypothetical protein
MIWSKQFGGGYSDVSAGGALDSQGNIYVTGTSEITQANFTNTLYIRINIDSIGFTWSEEGRS